MTSFTFVYEIQADSTLLILCANRLNVFLLVSCNLPVMQKSLIHRYPVLVYLAIAAHFRRNRIKIIHYAVLVSIL